MADSYGTYPGYQYQYTPESSPRVNGLELIILGITILALLGVAVWGFLTSTGENRDKQKESDMTQVMQALDYFYANNKAYPIRQCSEDLNPVDFEYFLRQNLTGKVAQVGNTDYIDGDFPRDRGGQYTPQAKNYIYNIPCPSVIQETVNRSGQIYTDGTEACNYNRLPTKTSLNPKGEVALRCYLYTSSVTGDIYRLGYYSESQGRFIIISRTRDQKPSYNYA